MGIYGTINNYYQLNIKNSSNNNTASSDLVATNDTGNDTGNYVNLGINSSGFIPHGDVGQPNDGYLYNTGSHFYIGNLSPNKNIYLWAGNATGSASSVTLNSAGNFAIGGVVPLNKLDVKGSVAIGSTYAGTNTAPANGLLVQGNVGFGTTSPYANCNFQLASSGPTTLFSVSSLATTASICWDIGLIPFSNGSFDWRAVVAPFPNGATTASKFFIDSWKDGNQGTTKFFLDDIGNASFPTSKLAIGGNNYTPVNTLDVSGNISASNITCSNIGVGTVPTNLYPVDIYIPNSGNGFLRLASNTTTAFPYLVFQRTSSVTDVSYGVAGANGQFLNAGVTASAGNAVFKNDNASGILFGIGSSGVLFINASLNSGFGTGAPLNKVDINGNLAVGTYAGTNNAPTNGAIISGNVGVGSASPITKFDVVTGSSSPAAKFVGLVGIGAAPNTSTLGQLNIIGSGLNSTTYAFRFENTAFDTSSASTGHTFKAWMKIYISDGTNTFFTDSVPYYIPVYA